MGSDPDNTFVLDPAPGSKSAETTLAEIVDLQMRLLCPPDLSVTTPIHENSKYSPLAHAQLCRMRMLGMSNTTAAKAAGISTSTLTAWIERYPKLAHDLEQADALKSAHVMVLLQQMMVADGTTAFSAVRLYLETHAPEFRRIQTLELQVPENPEQARDQIRQGLYGLPSKQDDKTTKEPVSEFDDL